MMVQKMKPTNKIRGLVSKKKRRFQENGFDLDLSYITDRIIAMGFPSEKLEGLYRNPMHEVQRFLESLHQDHYKVYNLCSERRYDHKKFHGRVWEFPFDDHNPCPLADIPKFCENVGAWLDEHPENVAVIHCKAGKGRTGTIICCFLMWCGLCRTASEAMQLFAARRTRNNKGVTLHSQRRYVRYYEEVLQNGEPEERVLRLQKIRMSTVPDFNKKQGGSEPWFSISRGTGATIYYSDPVKGKKGNQVVDFDCGNIRLQNDIKIEFFHKNLKGKMFYFWFHCGFVKDQYFCLRKRELEQACKDKACKHFAPGFKVELFFADEGASTVPNRGDINAGAVQMSDCVGCSRPMLATEASVVLASGTFHWECLRCDKCGKSFTGARNCIIKDGIATCERCDGDEFFTRCTSCFRPLTEHRFIEMGEHAWHNDCFRCFYCSKMLDHKAPAGFCIENDKPYCLAHKGMVPGNHTCNRAGCKKGDHGNMISSMGTFWHKDCFCCCECDRLLDAYEDDFYDLDGRPCCSSHDTPVTCISCARPIVPTSDAISALGEAWHARCFTCSEPGCERQFSPADTDVEMKMGMAICVRHGMRSCCYCTERIESRDVVEVDGRDWHRRCFVCSTCGAQVDPRGTAYIMADGLPSCKSHLRSCARCGEAVEAADLVLVQGEDLHSFCFCCDMQGCGVPLDPRGFVQHHGNRYCGSHPMCTSCELPIPEGDLYHDENGQFHSDCFRCASCSTPLDPQFCAFRGRRLLCSRCHPSPQCDYCKRILHEGHIAVLDRHYHDHCFVCYRCHAPFATADESVAVTPDGKPICANCNSIPCDKCGKGIHDEVVEALGKSYHKTCFTCERCQVPLLKSFGLLDGSPLCTSCLETNQHPICSACGQAMAGKYTIAAGKNYHLECFKCQNCQSQLSSGTYFTSGSDFFCARCADDPAVQGSVPAPADPRMPRLSCASATPYLGVPQSNHQQHSSTVSSVSALPAGGAATGSAIFKEGMLKKQGGRIKNWKKRWFVLDHSTVTYAVAKREAPLGTIKLNNNCTVEVDTTKKGNINLHTPTRNWRFIADSESEAMEWAAAFQRGIDA